MTVERDNHFQALFAEGDSYIVRLSGGLGNQLFQYLFGQIIARKEKTVVAYDASDCFALNAVRSFKLVELGLAGTFFRGKRYHFDEATSILIEDIVVIQGEVSSNYVSLPLFREKSFDFDPQVFEVAPCYFDGYWQSYKYLEILGPRVAEIREQLLRNAEARLFRCTDTFRTSASIHVRRGDYLDPAAKKYHGLCSNEYYRAALKEVLETEGSIDSVTLFSDDPSYAKTIFATTNIEITKSENSSDTDDFLQMMLCGAHVISNSSFSFLAAFLAGSPGLIVAPYPWFSAIPFTPDLIPPGWHLRNRVTGRAESADLAEIEQAKISVIIPSMNRSAFLAEAVETAMGQSLKPCEVIISLNASPPSHVQAAEALRRKYSCIRVIEDKVASLPRARNNGIKVACGDWLAFLDDDDIWDRDKLRLQIEIAVRHHIDVVSCNYVQFFKDSIFDVSNLPYRSDLPWSELLTLGNFFSGGSAVIAKREAVEAVGCFDESLASCEDHDMWRRLSHKYELYFLDKKMVRYRVAGDNMTKNQTLMLSGELAHFSKILAESHLISSESLLSACERLLAPLLLYLGNIKNETDRRDEKSVHWIEAVARRFGGNVGGMLQELSDVFAREADAAGRAYIAEQKLAEIQGRLAPAFGAKALGVPAKEGVLLAELEALHVKNLQEMQYACNVRDRVIEMLLRP